MGKLAIETGENINMMNEERPIEFYLEWGG